MKGEGKEQIGGRRGDWGERGEGEEERGRKLGTGTRGGTGGKERKIGIMLEAVRVRGMKGMK